MRNVASSIAAVDPAIDVVVADDDDDNDDEDEEGDDDEDDEDDEAISLARRSESRSAIAR